jgi:hypothetical protein
LPFNSRKASPPTRRIETKVSAQEIAGGDVGGKAAPDLAQRQHRGGEEDPARDLDQVTERKQQHENQQAGGAVFGDPLLQEGQVELAAQAGKLEHGEQQREEEGDGQQAFVAVHDPVLADIWGNAFCAARVVAARRRRRTAGADFRG